jgi:hypothetical protein
VWIVVSARSLHSCSLRTGAEPRSVQRPRGAVRTVYSSENCIPSVTTWDRAHIPPQQSRNSIGWLTHIVNLPRRSVDGERSLAPRVLHQRAVVEAVLRTALRCFTDSRAPEAWFDSRGTLRTRRGELALFAQRVAAGLGALVEPVVAGTGVAAGSTDDQLVWRSPVAVARAVAFAVGSSSGARSPWRRSAGSGPHADWAFVENRVRQLREGMQPPSESPAE